MTEFDIGNLPDAEYLGRLKDYADRNTLARYEDGRKWYFLQNRIVKLGEVARAALVGDIAFIGRLLSNGSLIIKRSLGEIPGEHFLCIHFDDAYFLEPYE